jgi:hypothetical protein
MPAPPLIALLAFLPVNGAKEAFADGFANLQRCRNGAGVAVSPFSPFNGEKMPAGK